MLDDEGGDAFSNPTFDAPRQMPRKSLSDVAYIVHDREIDSQGIFIAPNIKVTNPNKHSSEPKVLKAISNISMSDYEHNRSPPNSKSANVKNYREHLEHSRMRKIRDLRWARQQRQNEDSEGISAIESNSAAEGGEDDIPSNKEEPKEYEEKVTTDENAANQYGVYQSIR